MTTPKFRAFQDPLGPVLFEKTGFDACENISRLKRANTVYEYLEFKIHQAKDADKKFLELDRGVLNKIFQNDEEGQKLMQSLLIRVDEEYHPTKRDKSGKVLVKGQCMKYQLHEVNFHKFEQNLFEGVLKFDVNREKLPTTVKKYLAKLDKQNREKLLADKRKKEDKLTNKTERGICCTDLSTKDWGLLFDPEFLSLSEKDQRKLTIKYSRHYQVLQGNAQIEYTEKTYRKWNGLQTIKSDFKPLFYKHTVFTHNYDIPNSAVTVIMSYVESRKGINTVEQFPNIHHYINNKKQVRQMVMDLFDIDYKQAKDVLMHLTNKGYISKSDKCRWKEVTNDPFGRKLHKLRLEGHFLLDFYAEVKELWRMAKEIHRDEFASGKIPVNPKSEHRFNLYFYLERQILDVITSKLDSAGISYLTEHDGVRTTSELDQAEIESEIFRQLQIKIKLEKQ